MQGMCLHWEAAAPRADHSQCAGQVESIRRYHLGQGYTDIAYSFLVCQHGQVFVGRGWDRQSGATCNSYWNSRYWSVCWMGGPGYIPSAAALTGLRSVVDQARARGGTHVIGHRNACSTQCPGDYLLGWIANGLPAASATTPAPTPQTPTKKAIGMLLRDKTNGRIYLISAGYSEWVKSQFRVDVLRFIGVPYADVSQTDIENVRVAYNAPTDAFVA